MDLLSLKSVQLVDASLPTFSLSSNHTTTENKVDKKKDEHRIPIPIPIPKESKQSDKDVEEGELLLSSSGITNSKKSDHHHHHRSRSDREKERHGEKDSSSREKRKRSESDGEDDKRKDPLISTSTSSSSLSTKRNHTDSTSYKKARKIEPSSSSKDETKNKKSTSSRRRRSRSRSRSPSRSRSSSLSNSDDDHYSRRSRKRKHVKGKSDRSKRRDDHTDKDDYSSDDDSRSRRRHKKRSPRRKDSSSQDRSRSRSRSRTRSGKHDKDKSKSTSDSRRDRDRKTEKKVDRKDSTGRPSTVSGGNQSTNSIIARTPTLQPPSASTSSRHEGESTSTHNATNTTTTTTTVKKVLRMTDYQQRKSEGGSSSASSSSTQFLLPNSPIPIASPADGTAYFPLETDTTVEKWNSSSLIEIGRYHKYSATETAKTSEPITCFHWLQSTSAFTKRLVADLVAIQYAPFQKVSNSKAHAETLGKILLIFEGAKRSLPYLSNSKTNSKNQHAAEVLSVLLSKTDAVLRYHRAGLSNHETFRGLAGMSDTLNGTQLTVTLDGSVRESWNRTARLALEVARDLELSHRSFGSALKKLRTEGMSVQETIPNSFKALDSLMMESSLVTLVHVLDGVCEELMKLLELKFEGLGKQKWTN